MRAAIFDLDGTLVDSMPYWRNHLAELLAEYGLPVPNDMEIRVNQNGSFNLLFEEIQNKNPNILFEDIVLAYHEKMRPEYEHYIQAKAFALEYLSKLKSEKMPMCLATATPKNLFMPMFKRLNMAHYFDFCITVPEIGIGKSKPDIYLYCAKQYHLTPQDCVVFEDTIQAITTVKNAGFQTFAVADQISSWAEPEIRLLSDKFITNYEDLL